MRKVMIRIESDGDYEIRGKVVMEEFGCKDDPYGLETVKCIEEQLFAEQEMGLA